MQIWPWRSLIYRTGTVWPKYPANEK